MNHRMRPVLTALCLSSALQPTALWAGGDGAPNGAKIVDESCASCHASGLMGAPRIGDSSEWQGRLQRAGSMAALLSVTQRGKGNMPPRGGESSLSDAELESAVQYMLNKSGVTY